MAATCSRCDLLAETLRTEREVRKRTQDALRVLLDAIQIQEDTAKILRVAVERLIEDVPVPVKRRVKPTETIQ